jgi:Uncharacterised nucleotidyltransferase
LLSATEGFELGRVEIAVLRSLVSWSSTTLEKTLELPASVDWRRLLNSAERHRLSPLVLRGMQRSGALPRAPRGELERLENVRNLELAKAVVRLHHLDELGAIAFDEGKDLYLLKGAAFAAALYSDPGLRPMADIDVLSTESGCSLWRERLERLGYVAIDRSDHATCFRRRQTGVILELHHELVSSARYLGLSTGEVIERSIPVATPSGIRLRTLAWEDHLLHLCLHGSFQHGFRQPAVNAWDARSIVERADFDLPLFIACAGRPRLSHWAYGGLAMCEAVFPGSRLLQARGRLEQRVSPRVARKARAFRPETLLAPGPEAVFGPPYRRLAWNGITMKTLSLLWEISRPRQAHGARPSTARVDRILQLVRNHGIGIFRSARQERACPTNSSRPASLGEVRDV